MDVDFRVQPAENDLQTIEYVISRGPAIQVSRTLAITGNNTSPTDVIRERMFMQPGVLQSAARPLQRSVPAQGRGEYRQPVPLQRFSRREGELAWWTATIKASAGDIAVTREYRRKARSGWSIILTVDGIEQVDREELTAATGVRRRAAVRGGEPGAAIATTCSLTTTSTAFPDADFQGDLAAAARAPHHVNVIYTITEGDRQYVRDVVTSGLAHHAAAAWWTRRSR